MQRLIVSLLGMACAFALLKYRERVGDSIGDAEWMQKVGGVYNVVILVSLFIFFWSIAYLTGTEDFFLAPIKYLIPGLIKKQGPEVLL